MSGPVRTLVPLGVGGAADVGLAAAALVYGERVTILVESPEHLATFVDWFVAPGEIETLIIWLRDGVIGWASTRADFRGEILEHPLIAKLLHGQWRHSRFLKYGGVNDVAGEDSGVLDAARALKADLVMPAEAVEQSVATLHSAGRFGIETRKVRTGIPDVRTLIDSGGADLRDLLRWRRQAAPLRQRQLEANEASEGYELTIARVSGESWSASIIGT